MKFEKRKFELRNEMARAQAMGLIKNLPLDTSKPLQITVEEFKKPRKLDQNAAMWSGPLRDISEQAWLDGRKFSAEVWHEFFKRELLPDDSLPEFDESEVKDGYTKWEFGPDGARYLVGTTTKLSVRGMALYIQKVEAFGANLGVRFSVNPNDRGI